MQTTMTAQRYCTGCAATTEHRHFVLRREDGSVLHDFEVCEACSLPE